MTKGKRIFLYVAAVLLAASLAVGAFFAGDKTAVILAAKPTATAPIENFNVFWEAWNIVKRDYVGTLPDDEILARGAAKGLAASYNDHVTGLIDPEYAALDRENSSGLYKGIGASVRETEDGYISIAVIFPNSPAGEAGLRVDDVIVNVDGQDIHGLSVYEVVSMIRGPEHTQVKLQVRRAKADSLLEISVERREIEIPNVTLEILPEGIAHITLAEFNSMAQSQLRKTIADAESQGAWAYILDLRDNPGGFLDQAVAVTDEFLDDGVAVIERGRENPELIYHTHDGGVLTTAPLAILVNKGSASASEIVAGAVQARKRGILVGVTTYGKGSVQYAFDLKDGSELRVTTALWYTPDNRLIQGQGLTPDIVVEADGEGVDQQLQAAVKYLLEHRQ